jgi:hypothetical protein
VQIDVTHRLIEWVDPEPIRAQVELHLARLFDHPDRAIWRTVEDRMRWVGAETRPPDVGFRKMRPQGYVQICLANDEDPYSPWAVAVPEEVDRAALDETITTPMTALCLRQFGDGILYFCGLAILAPGGVIPRHRDMPHDVDKKAWSHHLHVPITHASETEFTIGKQTFTLEAGGVYEINNQKPHSVVNRGSGYRVNLMLDYCPAGNLERRNRHGSK